MTFRCPKCGADAVFPICGFICFPNVCNGETIVQPHYEAQVRYWNSSSEEKIEFFTHRIEAEKAAERGNRHIARDFEVRE